VHVEAWNGKRWTLQANPATGRLGGALTSVSCTAPMECTAVGYLPFQNEALAEHEGGVSTTGLPIS
jgi:hypothetical protein